MGCLPDQPRRVYLFGAFVQNGQKLVRKGGINGNAPNLALFHARGVNPANRQCFNELNLRRRADLGRVRAANLD